MGSSKNTEHSKLSKFENAALKKEKKQKSIGGFLFQMTYMIVDNTRCEIDRSSKWLFRSRRSRGRNGNGDGDW